jgi:ubiquinone/menaquinone biosynthesis C-methylase UbiE
MSEADKVFAGSIPEIYDRFLVPLIFDAFAGEMAERVADGAPLTVLETAAGSGVVARALAPRLDPAARFVVTDLNQPMLDRAAARQGEDGRIAWRQADALQLPFADAGFDVVCCQFGAMFFPDKVRAFGEARRVLKPGGRFVFSVWDRIEENLFADLVTNALGELLPETPPRFLARTPHGYSDRTQVVRDLEQAGFDEFTVETVARQSRAARPADPAIAYCQGTPLRNEIEAARKVAVTTATDHAAAAIARHCGDGPVAGKIQAHVFVAVA